MPAKFDKMVKAIKKSGSAVNPFAVARAKLGSNADIRAGRKPKGK
jgi:hypothetical protein